MGRKDKEEKGSFGQRFLKGLGIFALTVSLMFAGSSFLTACSPSTPPATPPGIITPAPGEDDDDKKPEEPGTETPEPEDPQPENPGEGGSETEDPNKGEEGKGEEGEGEETTPGEGEEEEEVDVSTLLYYTDDQDITHYNVKGMIESTFAQYNARTMNKKPYSYTLADVNELNDENTTILASRFNAEAEEGSQLELVLIVNDDEGNNKLIKVEQKIDIDAISEDKEKVTLTDLDEYYNGLNIVKFAPRRDYLIRSFDTTFLPGEDGVADAVVDIIKKDSIIDAATNKRVANPDFKYVLGFKKNEEMANEGPVVCPDNTLQAVGIRWKVDTWYLVNKDGNLSLVQYQTLANVEKNFQQYDNDIGKTFLGNLQNKEYYINYLEKETVLLNDYEMEYQRESTPSAGEPTL